MKKHIVNPLAMGLVLMLVACTTPSGPVFAPVADIPQDQGVVYVYRPSSLLIGDVRIAIDGQFVGLIGNGGYIVTRLSPALHVVGISPYESRLLTDPSFAPLDLNITAGRAHYIRAVPSKTGPYSWEVIFQELDERTALPEIQTRRLQE